MLAGQWSNCDRRKSRKKLTSSDILKSNIDTKTFFSEKQKTSKSRARLCFGEIFCLLKKTMLKKICFVNILAEDTKSVHQI
jgi:hypothetical protein